MPEWNRFYCEKRIYYTFRGETLETTIFFKNNFLIDFSIK